MYIYGILYLEMELQVTVAQSKRSRTQVYSGKRAQSGPQGQEFSVCLVSLADSLSSPVVASLFDMCMKILIDNIDGESCGISDS